MSESSFWRDSEFDGFDPNAEEVRQVKEVLDLSDISVPMGMAKMMLVDFIDRVELVVIDG